MLINISSVRVKWKRPGTFQKFQQQNKRQWAQTGICAPYEHEEKLSYYKSDRALAQFAQRGCGGSFSVDNSKLTWMLFFFCVTLLQGTCSRRGLDYMTSIHPF